MKNIAVLLLFFCLGCQTANRGGKNETVLNDVHSRLNATRVAAIESPRSTQDIVRIIKRAKKDNRAVSISGGKHAMGGQQFGEGTVNISMKEMNDVLFLDKEKGIVRVEAGITWPQLIEKLLEKQKDESSQWSIVQKQTGADHLTLGGALAANAHGRGVKYKPIIQDVESFTIVNADGEVLNVSRVENPELFSLAIGGYGLFGVIATIDLRLKPRQKLQRSVEIIGIDQLPEKARQKIDEGAVYGDFQYKTDPAAPDFMQVGVLSTYKPVANDTPVPQKQEALTPEKWYHLIHLAHTDKAKAFKAYSQYYLSTDGQIYWSDTHQLSFYADGYIEYLEKVAPDLSKGSLMITEVYVPRDRLNDLIFKIIDDVREHQMNVIYGTMRLIERDDESFLAWAKQDYACVIFNLRVEHDAAGMARAREDFQRLIDRALEMDGSYFLTYHRWARKDQVLRAYPRFPEFLALKLKYDSQERFQSEWYRHYKTMFSEELEMSESG